MAAEDMKSIEIEDNNTAVDFDSGNTTAKVSDLVQKIESLEREKNQLLAENEAVKAWLRDSETEVGGLRSAIEEGKFGERMWKTVEARAGELEKEVEKLREELAAAMNEGDEANAEVREVRKALEVKGLEIEKLVNEKESMRDSLARQIEEEFEAKSDVEARAAELENEVKSAEVEFSSRLNDKAVEISGLKRRIQDLEDVAEKNVVELDVIRAGKDELENALKVSKEAVSELESKLVHLQKEAEEAEKMITGFKENTRAINGISMSAFSDEDSKSFQIPAMATAASITIVVAGALFYFHYRKRG